LHGEPIGHALKKETNRTGTYIGSFFWNRTLDGGVRDDLFRLWDALGEPERISISLSLVLGESGNGYSKGYRFDASFNLDGSIKTFFGVGLIEGRSLSLTVDYNLPVGGGGPSDMNITSKFSRTTPRRGFIGTKISGTLGSGSGNLKAGVGFVFGSSGTKPAIGFDKNF